MPARMPSWAWVSGLTAAAVAAVAVLAVQAERGPHPTAAAAHPRPSASASAGAHSPSPTPKHTAPPAVPSASGTGRRIVYSLARKRVWLVDAGGRAPRTFTAWPGTVTPDPGTYQVSLRRKTTIGSDGVPIEHIVYFASKSGLSIAFSNARDGSSPPPPAGTPTSGIRLRKADGTAVWKFTATATTVTVVK